METDPALQVSGSGESSPKRLARICIVATEIEGPFFNGGVGSTNRWLALALRRMGHAVDIVYTQVSEGQPVCLQGTFAGHVAEYARHGVSLRAIFNLSKIDDWPSRSWLVMQHLIAERYDLVFFDDIFGTAYYPLLARQTGAPSLSGTVMVVTAHGVLEWVSEQEETAILNVESLHLFEMERRSLELADVVKAPSRYILDTYARYGWTLPADVVVMPNFVSETGLLPETQSPSPSAVDEIVFFGRLETRKGIWLFLRAIDRIKYRLGHRKVTFLGKTRANGTAILRHTLGWPCNVQILSNFNQEQAVAYMRGPRRIAVMPSPADNSPSTVLECLNYGIPFLTTSGSGAEELIDPSCHAATLVEPTVDALAERLLQTLETGGSTARHAFDPDELLGRFHAFVGQALARRNTGAARGTSSGIAAIIAQAPNGMPPVVTVAKVRGILSGLKKGTILHILSDQPDAVQALLADTEVRVFANAALAAAALAAEVDRLGAVALCALSGIPHADWFQRAQTCFARGIRAVTGMTRSSAEAAKQPEAPWFIHVPAVPVERYLMGNAAALMHMAASTNSGFALFHPDLLPLVIHCDDGRQGQGRPRPLTTAIRDLLAAVVATGARFELIPDLGLDPVEADGMSWRTEVTGSTDAGSPVRGRAGDALWAVHRLGADAILEHSRRAEAKAQRDALALRFSFPIDPVTSATPRERQIADLARIAMATGQIRLATELMAGLHPAVTHRDAAHLHDFVQSEAAAIHLLDGMRDGRFSGVNLIHDYSLKVVSDTEANLHANACGEPRASLVFSGLIWPDWMSFRFRFCCPTADRGRCGCVLISSRTAMVGSLGSNGTFNPDRRRKCVFPCHPAFVRHAGQSLASRWRIRRPAIATPTFSLSTPASGVLIQRAQHYDHSPLDQSGRQCPARGIASQDMRRVVDRGRRQRRHRNSDGCDGAPLCQGWAQGHAALQPCRKRRSGECCHARRHVGDVEKLARLAN